MAVACGSGHTLILAEGARQLFACGSGCDGQLGSGMFKNQRMPGLLRHNGETLVMVAAGRFHSAASTSAGELLTCGFGKDGQLGHGGRHSLHTPERLGRARFGGSPVLMVACGGFHTLVVTEAGLLFAFGHGAHGQLGLDDPDGRDVPAEVGRARLGWAPIVYAAAGNLHSGAVTSAGVVFTWGKGYAGQLGHGDEQDQLVPRELAGQFDGRKATMLAAGAQHTVVLTADGAVWACGSGSYGQLGVGDTAGRLAPARAGAGAAFGERKVRMVACGFYHTVAVKDQGELWAWGRGVEGQLGHNDRRDRMEPQQVGVEWMRGAKIVTAACGEAHTAAVTEEGALYTWGAGRLSLYPGCKGPGGLGHEDLADKLVPTLVAPRLLLGARVGRCLALGRLHVVALAMGTHGRLGGGAGGRKSRRVEGKEPAGEAGGSPIMLLAGELGLLRMIAEACREQAEGEAEGVVRLLGGLRRRGTCLQL